ncbi:ERI1 exoribonuclease 2-like [Montipora foliosa]|uniref:ERI1 exoribonuclease 2-like n=1 Tax=Montipora foliosa TaxID=591990 RepID=UPI0035F1457A
MTSKGNKPLQQLSCNAASAKELARSLGLVKKRPSSSGRAKGQENKVKLSQYFAYLIVLDFESTCWRDKKLNYGPEIIEFPAVLLNTSTGALESEFHMFVQPNEHRKLSEFCTELTGITQTQVDEGVPIGTCLMLFGRWLQKIKDTKSLKFPCDLVQRKDQAENVETSDKLCTFMTWSDWDLGNCLKNECYRKQLRMPQPLRSWIDLRATYKNFYSRKPQGLAGALQDLGIQFAGRQHSGLDDARNTARLAWRMISDGCIMQITKSLDGMAEKLWNDRLKNADCPFDARRSDKLAKRTLLQVASHKRDDNLIFKSLNFSAPHTESLSKPGVKDSAVRKRKLTASGRYNSIGQMTQIKHKVPVLEFPENKIRPSRDWQERIAMEHKTAHVNGTLAPSSFSDGECSASCAIHTKSDKNRQEILAIKKRASRSVCIMNRTAFAPPVDTLTSLLTPITSLKKEALSHLKTEDIPKTCLPGFRIKSQLVEQTLCPNQNTPWRSSRNCLSSNGIGQKEGSEVVQPCKASNIEPGALNIPLFKSSISKSCLIDKSKTEAFDKSLNRKSCYTVGSSSSLIDGKNEENILKSEESKEGYASVSSATPDCRINMFSPVPGARIKTPRASPPVVCFNGGGVTPPLCHCGRRTRRRSVINPGPNQGRAFFTCSVNHGRPRSTLSSNFVQKSSKSCNFFRWEVR